MMITGDQVLAHIVGDYFLQSRWMATNKTKKSWVCIIHVLMYALPFLLLTTSPLALGVICGSHLLIDRFYLGRYACWALNHLGPGNRPWRECKTTGYAPDVNIGLAWFLLIIIDNTIHVVINGLAIKFL